MESLFVEPVFVLQLWFESQCVCVAITICLVRVIRDGCSVSCFCMAQMLENRVLRVDVAQSRRGDRGGRGRGAANFHLAMSLLTLSLLFAACVVEMDVCRVKVCRVNVLRSCVVDNGCCELHAF